MSWLTDRLNGIWFRITIPVRWTGWTNKKYKEVHMKGSWKTTVAGAIAALGGYLTTVTEPSWLSTLGKTMATLGTLAIGLFARDNNVTSENAGAK